MSEPLPEDALPEWALNLAGEMRVWCRELGAEECEGRIAAVLVSMAGGGSNVLGVFGE